MQKKKEVRGRNGGLLIPPTHGEVRNPNGRPVGSLNRKTIIRKFFELKKSGKDFDGNEKIFSIYELGVLKQIEKMLSGEIDSFKLLSDYFEGTLTHKTENKNINKNIPPIFPDITNVPKDEGYK